MLRVMSCLMVLSLAATAETDLAWKFDVSARAVPQPVAVTRVNAAAVTLRQAFVVSIAGSPRHGLIVIAR